MSVTAYRTTRATATTKDLSDDPPIVTKLETIDITERQSRYGGRSQITLTADVHKPRDGQERFQEYALIHRRMLDDEGRLTGRRLEFQSHVLRKALRDVLGYYPSVNLESNPIVMDLPFAPLWHYQNELRDYSGSLARSQEELTRLKVLVNFMRVWLQDTVSARDRLMPSKLITYDLVWTLFRPDDIVISRSDHFTEAYMFQNLSSKVVDNEVILVMELRSWDYNGIRFGPRLVSKRLSSFIGNKSIHQLDVYPLEYHDEHGGSNLVAELIKRGQTWRNVVKVAHRDYNGLIWTDETLEQQELTTVHVDGRIIVDYTSHAQAKPLYATSLAISSGETTNRFDMVRTTNTTVEQLVGSRILQVNRYGSFLDDETYTMTPIQALLSPARVRGFSLVEKIWGFFLVEQVNDIEWAVDSFEALEIDAAMKNVVKALVHSHNNNLKVAKFDDFIQRKGRGLIFLLTGLPGLGKTLTAETIAEEERKPLYAITSGELGNTAQEADSTLRQIFARAHHWGAILLLDEADVFLAKRSPENLERNAFVSIFLRLIEYYQGILFLTTNRVHEFDEAFQSRIHLTINYRPLDAQRRSIIWRNLLKRASTSAWNEQRLEQLGQRYCINGREIKNLIRTSATIAEYNEEELTEKHIDMVYMLNTANSPDIRSPLP